MNESKFDNLSDVELREQLQKYGLPLVPITETTRNLLVRRLKNQIENTSLCKKREKRRSLQTTLRQANPSPARRQSSQILRRSVDCFSDRPEPEAREPKAIPHTMERMNRLPKEFDGVGATGRLGDGNNMSHKSPKASCDYYRKSSPKIYLPPPILSNDIQYTSKRYEPSKAACEPETYGNYGPKEYSGVVSRLLKLRDITMRSTLPTCQVARNNFYLTDSDSDSGGFTSHTTCKRRTARSLRNTLWNRLNLTGKFKQSSVPYILINCLVIFFFVIAVLYVTKPPDMPSTMLETSTTFTLCEELTQMADSARPSINCIENNIIDTSLALNKELIQLLQANTETHFCKDRTIKPEVSGLEFIKYLYQKRTPNMHNMLKSFNAAIYLIENNPQWKIQILNKSDNQQLIDIYRQDVRFILHKPYLPLNCILFNKIQRFLFIVGTVSLIAFFLALAYLAWRFVQQKKLQNIKIVDNFCSEIKKEIMLRNAQTNDANQDGTIINHLRDKLIPINKKKSLLWAWNEALRKLESSDSRIQFGFTMHNGEEFRTMKWVESFATPSPVFQMHSSANKESCGSKLHKKHWQSPAFDNVNKIFEPPTNCLKIRHMFEAAEANLPDLKQSIVEALLEKVGPQCLIYDIQLDRQNCCVYIRCATEKDAGIVHNEVNGWWFDNRLVSIKFLRLQRFLIRYPNSTSNTPLTIQSESRPGTESN